MPHDIESACASLLTLLEQLKHQGQLTNCTYKLYLNIQKTKIMVSGPITSWEIDGETVDTVVFHDSMWAVGTSPSDPVGDSLTSAELKDWLYVVL